MFKVPGEALHQWWMGVWGLGKTTTTEKNCFVETPDLWSHCCEQQWSFPIMGSYPTNWWFGDLNMLHWDRSTGQHGMSIYLDCSQCLVSREMIKSLMHVDQHHHTQTLNMAHKVSSDDGTWKQCNPTTTQTRVQPVFLWVSWLDCQPNKTTINSTLVITHSSIHGSVQTCRNQIDTLSTKLTKWTMTTMKKRDNSSCCLAFNLIDSSRLRIVRTG